MYSLKKGSLSSISDIQLPKLNLQTFWSLVLIEVTSTLNNQMQLLFHFRVIGPGKTLHNTFLLLFPILIEIWILSIL